MVSAGHLAAFAALAFLMIVVPGPSVLFTIGRALTVGRRDALPTVAGNAVGGYLHGVAVAFGLGALVAGSATVFTVVKLVGAGCLVYLGVPAVRHRRALGEALHAPSRRAPGRTFTVLRDGFVVGFANPKSIVFLAAVLPQFVDHCAGSVPVQILLLGVVLPLVAVCSDSAWALLAGTARAWFAGSPRRLELPGGAGGVVMIGLGATLAVTGRTD
jgi:threonine/homoserine/homoserine lactone efflux protein